MFGIGGFELFIIVLFGFLVFGPDKLPEIARTVGVALRKFKQAQEEMESVIKDEVLETDGAKSKKPSSSHGSTAVKPRPKSTAASSASQESFAVRKARYDEERARTLKKKQEIEANRRAMREEAAKKAAQDAQRVDVATPVQTGNAPDDHTQALPCDRQDQRVSSETLTQASEDQSFNGAALTPDELFGLKPTPKKSHSQPMVETDAIKEGGN